jgi:hypothetical protein
MPKIYEFKRGFKSQSENKSVELRKELKISPSLPLSGNKLAQHLKVKIIFPDMIEGLDNPSLKCLLNGNNSGWSGAAIQAGSQALVLINSSHSLARQESSIMHEMAHLILGHQMGEFLMLADGIFLRGYNQDQEKEAEWFGGCLQLPRVALYMHFIKYRLTIEEIAEKFNASTDMVKFRLNVCNVRR